jgi:hypothetical protein
MPVILITQEAEIRKITVRGQPVQSESETLSQKYPTQKRAGRVAQVACLTSKYEALSANHSTTKKKKKSLS